MMYGDGIYIENQFVIMLYQMKVISQLFNQSKNIKMDLD